MSGITGAINDYVNENKDGWGNKTGQALDSAINIGLDKANDYLEEQKKANGASGGSPTPAPGGEPTRLFNMQKVVTEVGTGSLLTMFYASLALFTVGFATFLASRRAFGSAREQEHNLQEELQSVE